MKKTCAKCGSQFECQQAKSCWCFEEARLTEKDIEFNDCVCKKCLLLQYRKKLGM